MNKKPKLVVKLKSKPTLVVKLKQYSKGNPRSKKIA